MSENAQKVVVITGGTSGIGFAAAQKFAGQGFNIVLIARSPEGLQDAREKLAGSGVKIFGVKGDLSTPANIPEVLAEVSSVIGGIDVFVNNAGLAKFASVPNYSDQDYDDLFNFNVKVPFLLIQGFLPQLVQRRGTIVNVSTYWANKMVRGRYSSLYSASRGAMVSMVKALANELAESGVRVNAVAPGSTETESLVRWRDSLSPAALEAFVSETEKNCPLGRLGLADEVADAIVFLATEKSRWVTGQTLNVDGGFTVR